MSTESSPTEISPGLYETDGLALFDKRQVWTDQLTASPRYQFMTVGENEVLRLSRVKEPGLITRSESELSLIREVVQTGTIKIRELQDTQRITNDLQQALDSLVPPAESLEVGFDFFKALINIERTARAKEKIHAAAGYIAARRSLWVVTKSEPLESKTRVMSKMPLKVGVARLVGITLDPNDAKHVEAHPVVSGKNGVIGRLHNVQHDTRPQLRPRVFDVIEGIRTRP